jgi:hypothetical protein
MPDEFQFARIPRSTVATDSASPRSTHSRRDGNYWSAEQATAVLGTPRKEAGTTSGILPVAALTLQGAVGNRATTTLLHERVGSDIRNLDGRRAVQRSCGCRL